MLIYVAAIASFYQCRLRFSHSMVDNMVNMSSYRFDMCFLPICVGAYAYYQCICTTGTTGFPECQLHSGKAQLHLGKPSPSATLGEEPPANPPTEKAPSPSVENRALGKGFAECRTGTRGRLDAVGQRPTSFSFFFFPECNTRERFLNFF